MKARKAQQGVTLLEAILTIIIASAILVAGIRMYSSYQRDNDIRALNYNIETLAQSTANYYYANCFGQSRPDGGGGRTFEPGALHPDSSPDDPYQVNITNDLLSKGFLANKLRPNPLVDVASAGNGYSVQLEKAERIKTVCTEEPNCSDADAVQIGTVINYSIQIGVKLANSDMANVVSSMTGATCITSTRNDGGLVSCSQSGAFKSTCTIYRYYQELYEYYGYSYYSGLLKNYADSYGCPASSDSSQYNNTLMYERQPFAIQNQSVPALWPSLNVTKRFTDRERTPSMDSLLSTSHDPEYNYYLCGS